jgi:tRNA wybutosine-synthesizing protein 4
MDFQEKNFRYVQKSFETFLEEVSRGSRQYLRSIASTDPSGKPADFWINFPELGPDFELPSEYDTVKRNMHSSVLRVSGTVAIWLHYDVMANVLCQIKGSKRLILYPPSDVSLFSIPPGTSSSSINCFDASTTKDPTLALAHPQEVFLEPGDILFLPPLWLHTASPTGNVSISVNVFFRNLDRGYAPGRDLYGNRDLQAYEKGRQDIAKIAESFNKLPPDFGRFYLERLAEELRTKALSYSL